MSQDDTQLRIDIATIRLEVEILKKTINSFVTQFEFTPIKIIVYALSSMIGAAVIGAILAKVIIK